MALTARRGKRVPTMGYRAPRREDSEKAGSNFHRTWFNHLQWKAWRLDRLGGGYTPRL